MNPTNLTIRGDRPGEILLVGKAMLNQKTDTLYQKPAYITPSWTDSIREEMNRVELRLRATPKGQHDMLTNTIHELFNAGGKRVRPSVCLLTARLMNADMDNSISIAAAVEMLHTATLVHDDLIDGAMFRRGIATLNSIWSSDVSVLAGDYLFARAASLIAGVEIVPVMKLFARTLEVILNGEITQKFSKWQIDRKEYEDRIYAKTAALFILSTQSAALLAGADTTSLKALVEFGYSIGMAFQIVDDVLDYVGTEDKMGKPIGGDLRQGLFTLPAILFSKAHPQDEDIQTLLANRETDPVLTERVIEKIQNSESIQSALDEARAHLDRGYQALDIFPPSIFKESLLGLAEETVNRDF